MGRSNPNSSHTVRSLCQSYQACVKCLTIGSLSIFLSPRQPFHKRGTPHSSFQHSHFVHSARNNSYISTYHYAFHQRGTVHSAHLSLHTVHIILTLTNI